MLCFKAYEVYRCKTKFIQEITIPSLSLTKKHFIDEAFELNHWIFDGGISNHSYSQLALLALCSSATQIWYAFDSTVWHFPPKYCNCWAHYVIYRQQQKGKNVNTQQYAKPWFYVTYIGNYLSNKNQVSLRMTIWARKIWRGWQVHYTIIIQQILYPQFLPPDLEISRSDRQRRISQMIKSIW